MAMTMAKQASGRVWLRTLACVLSRSSTAELSCSRVAAACAAACSSAICLAWSPSRRFCPDIFVWLSSPRSAIAALALERRGRERGVREGWERGERGVGER